MVHISVLGWDMISKVPPSQLQMPAISLPDGWTKQRHVCVTGFPESGLGGDALDVLHGPLRAEADNRFHGDLFCSFI